MNTFSLHKIEKEREFPFSPSDYSKFKFGCKDSARKFGLELGEAFAQKYIVTGLITGQTVILSSPYCFIPTATFAMKDYFVQVVNEYLVQYDLPVAQETKIHRTITYKEDYGELSAAQRMALIQNDSFHIDTEFIKGKTLILLDDVKITGSHERVIERMMSRYGVENNRIYVYFAELSNKAIHPNVENFLNYYSVKNLLDLDRIIKNENFLINTRVVKYILNYNHEDFKVFIQYQRIKFSESLYHLAIGNSYHLIPDYQANLFYLKRDILNK